MRVALVTGAGSGIGRACALALQADGYAVGLAGRRAKALEETAEQADPKGGEVLTGGQAVDRPGFFVEPTLVRATPGMTIWHEETFAPILYIMEYEDLDEATRDKPSPEDD